MTLTYPEVGATRTADLPAGYRHVRRRVEVPDGDLAAVKRGMEKWGIHRGAGLAVRASGAPEVGLEFASGLGVGGLRLWVPCRVVWVRDEPDAYGYGFGSLEGHPESGEEAFLATRNNNVVVFEVRAFSRPAAWYARLGRPLANLLQDRVSDRYATAGASLAR